MSDTSSLPPLNDAPLSVVLLAAEAVDVLEVATSWRDVLTEAKRAFEILVVGAEGNSDLAALGTQPTAQGAVFRLVTYAGPEGEGPALRAAIAAARHPLLLVAPCDKQYHPKDIEPFFTLINEVHLVAGYRVWKPVPGWLAALDWVKRALARIFLGYLPPARQFWIGWAGWRRRWLGRWIFGLRLQDIECRLRLFRKEAVEPPIQAHGSFAHIEILAKMNHLGCMMAEAPVSWMPPKVEARDETFASDAMLVFRRPEFRVASSTALPQEPPQATVSPM